jgi:hypothetical protein
MRPYSFGATDCYLPQTTQEHSIIYHLEAACRWQYSFINTEDGHVVSTIYVRPSPIVAPLSQLNECFAAENGMFNAGDDASTPENDMFNAGDDASTPENGMFNAGDDASTPENDMFNAGDDASTPENDMFNAGDDIKQ